MTYGGQIPSNTHGGLLSFAHPGMPGSLFHFHEVITQLRVQRGPSRAGAGLQGRYPHAVLPVNLKEGPRMISTYTGGRPDDVTFDMNVMLVCEPIDDRTTLPRFRRA